MLRPLLNHCGWILGGYLLSICGRTTPATAAEWPAGVRATMLPSAGALRTGFTEITDSRTGITFTNLLTEARALTNQIYLNGSGVAAGDVDGDGRCDLYFAGLDSPNALFLNRGDWRFEDATAAAGVACVDQASTGVALADLDGDGDLDLIVNAINHGPRVFLNDGHGRFREVTETAGLGGAAGGMSLALADVDGDGDLDLYVVNYRFNTMRDEPEKRFRLVSTNGVYQLITVDGHPASAPEFAGRFAVDPSAGVLENGEPDALFLNDGAAHFTRVSWTQGGFRDEEGNPIRVPYDWGLSAMFHDLNGDGAPDLYVCNDFQSPDRIWLNDGLGGFRALPRFAVRQTSLFSMGVDFADVDRDGFTDFFVADMLSREHRRRQIQVMEGKPGAANSNVEDRPQYSRNTLFHQRADGTFAEIARLAGVEASEWSWCPVFLDVDLDGYEDLLITTGHGRDAQNADVAAAIEGAKRQRRLSFPEQLELRRQFPALKTPNIAFRNRGDLTFEEVGKAWGFDSPRISQGLVLADLDGDGDLDVVINCLNEAPLIYRNDAPQPRVSVSLRGKAPNTHGIGAKVTVTAPGLPPQSQEIIAGGRYLSSDEARRSFAAGEPGTFVDIEVRWRSGLRSNVTNLPTNHRYEFDEMAAVQITPVTVSAITPWFTDMSAGLHHLHIDEAFDDFSRQPLLPRSLSVTGPGVTWFDFNGDGWDDLIVGTGRGGRLAVFRNDTRGGFVPQRAEALKPPAERGLTTVLGWRPDETGSVLVMGLSNYEDGRTNGSGVREFNLGTGEMSEILAAGRGCVGPLVLGDLDGDRALDLFVGGGAVSGRYPEAAASRLFRSHAGRLELDLLADRTLAGVGLVNDAAISDLDEDGRPELILATDWGPLRIFRYEPTGLVAWDPLVEMTSSPRAKPIPLSQLTGQWNSVAAGDFDNDGRMDFVAGNWGRNTRHQRSLAEPLELYFGSADSESAVDLLEAHWDYTLRTYVPTRDWATLSRSFPPLRDRYANFTAFSTASLADVLKTDLPPMRKVAAQTLDSMLFLNRGDHLEARPLPREAQEAPVFGLAVGDLDGDGNEDVFLAQNFFGVSAVESRYDAGLGVWLRGDGLGGLTAVSSRESGLRIEGEGRGAALTDFDQDGRLDLAVGQNRGATRLYRNVRSKPGVRVRLRGLPPNLQAIGAQVRLVYRDGTKGPIHEVSGGGGYRSQAGADLVLGRPREMEALEIRWPGGALQRYPVADPARPIRVTEAR